MEDTSEIKNIQHTESKEVASVNEVVIKEEVYSELIDRTKNKYKSDGGEFQVFLLGKDGAAEKYVEVGIPHKSGVMASSEQIIEKLRSEIDEGYEIIADYHNHTKESVDVYKANGMPIDYATAPSSGDLDLDVPRQIQTELHQKQYPRLIGLYVEDQDRVIVNGFVVLSELTKDQCDSISFEDPLYEPDEPDDLGITLLPSQYTDPLKLKELGAIQSVNVKSVDDNGQYNQIENVGSNL